MKALIFSGTVDGRKLSAELADMGIGVTVSVATDYGAEEEGVHEGVQVISGKRPPEEIAEMLKDYDVCIDATHPFATHISKSIIWACEKAGVPHMRLGRPESTVESSDKVKYVSSIDEAVEWLEPREGNIMITTGAKELVKYAPLGGDRLFPRVLPMVSSLESCEKAGVPRHNIIAMQGPFGEEINVAIMHQFGISYMVTKDSGKAGGFDEKASAAEKAGVSLVIIKRPEEVTQTAEEIKDRCREILRNEA
jgi:precorrin-6Y C5,15-methyltransferase (decarboxylating)/precorrin-6A/cobalt-precorrin-6A reductase